MIRKITDIKDFLKQGTGLLVAASIVFTVIVAFQAYVDFLVENKLSNQKTLDQISAKIKPTLIFDSEKKILYGKDVMQNLVQDFDINKDKGGNVVNVIVTTKYLMTSPPFLQCLDSLCTLTPQKGNKFNWEYTLNEVPYLTSGASSHRTFKLEFIE